MISVVLIETENSENLGFIARVMKNFEIESLYLVNPQCDHQKGKALMLATHAKDVLKKAKVVDKKILEKFDVLIGTTAMLGKPSNVVRSPLTPRQVGEKTHNRKGKIGLVLGRESSGLTTEEVVKCDFITTIPSSKSYPTLNISHALAILLYEIFSWKNEHVSSHIPLMEKKDKDVLLQYINKVSDKLSYQTPQKKESTEKVWKRVIGKSLLTKKEASTLMGFFKKIAK